MRRSRIGVPSAAQGISRSRAAVRPEFLSDAVIPLCGVVGALALWGISLGTIHVRDITDLGLVSVMPPLSFVALAILVLGFANALARRSPTPVLLAHVLAAVFMLYGLPALVEEAPRFFVAWRHVGVVENLARTGLIDPSIDAYLNWAGFFSLVLLWWQGAGLSSAMDLVPWAPVVFMGTYLAPLVLIGRQATENPQVVWLGVWIFLLANWVGQDYLSPQAFAFLLYLSILGLTLRGLRKGPPTRLLGLGRFFARRASQLAEPRSLAVPYSGLVILLFAAAVFSHQLTPVAIVALFVGLACTAIPALRGMTVLMALLLGAWLSYFAITYVTGHVAGVLEPIGSVESTVAANVGDRLRGSPEHLIVVVVRIVLTFSLWALAALGTALAFRRGHRDLTLPFLAALPFGLILLQTYGGEILLRAFLFGLPFVTFLAAIPFIRTSRALTTVAVAALSLVLVGSFLVSRYGNERMEMATAYERAGADELYELAPPHSTLIAATSSVFWRHRDYEQYRHIEVTDAVLADDLDAIVARGGERGTDAAFLYLSRAQRAGLEIQGGITANDWDIFRESLALDGRFTRIYENPDVEIYELTLR